MKKTAIAIVAASTTLFASQAFAQSADKGGYVGLGFGQSNIALDSTDFSYLTTKNEKGNAFKIYGGEQINKNFAVEIGYANHGKATGTGPGYSDNYEASSLTLGGVGILPLAESGLSLLGMAGFSINMIKDAYVSPTQNITPTKSTTDFYYGLGAKYAFNKNFAIRLQYENFGKAGDQTQGTRSKLSLTSANIEYKF